MRSRRFGGTAEIMGSACRNGLHPKTEQGECRPCTAARYARYASSPKGRSRRDRHRATPKGIATQAAAAARYNGSEKGRVRQAAYNASEAGRLAVSRYRSSPKGYLTRTTYDSTLDRVISKMLSDIRRHQRAASAQLFGLTGGQNG